jgi:glycosyltransferase involved in cell wall biosynthesis
MTPDITVVILTYNEEMHLARAIASVRAIARDVLVVDSFSTDATVAIAQEAGARVLQHPFVNQARQFQWAMDEGAIGTEWVLRLDADEVLEADLTAAITERLPSLPDDVTGVNFNRKHIFLGRWIRHGGRYPLLMLRLFRYGAGVVEDRWMDEHIVLIHGRSITISGGFADHNLNNLTYFTAKHNLYATREAIEVVKQRYLGDTGDTAMGTMSRQARLKRWVKTRIYNRMPFAVAPLGYFLYRYIVQLGFLDGREGVIYHGLQGLWYRFLVAAKTVELERAIGKTRDPAEIAGAIHRETGHRIG